VNGCVFGARVAITARPDRTYRIAITGVPEYSRGPFRLRVRVIHPPPNDDFRNAARLRVGSSIVADMRDATLEPGEPLANAPRSVWFKLRAAVASRVRLRLCSPRLRTEELEVYTGSQVRRLTAISAADCVTTFDAEPNVTYRIRVGGYFDSGRTRLTARAVASIQHPSAATAPRRLTIPEAREATRRAVYRHVREVRRQPPQNFEIVRCSRRSAVRVGCRLRYEFVAASGYRYFCRGGTRVIEGSDGYRTWSWDDCYAESE
jgi:hypothetical protein